MSCTRAETLIALRNWGRPVMAGALAHWMGKSRNLVSGNLTALYARDLVDRLPHPAYKCRYVYLTKQVQG